MPEMLSPESSIGWQIIEGFLLGRDLIPVLGRGAICFGEEDEPFYPWLVKELGKKLGVEEATSLQALVCRYLALDRKHDIRLVYLALDDLLRKQCPAPGKLLRTLASLSQCRTFFTLGFDPLLEQALRAVRGYHRAPWAFSTHKAPSDLLSPEASSTTLGYLFGKASAAPGFHLWDADAIELVWQLQRQLPVLNTLGRTLADNNLLIIGAEMSDWAVRFLLRAIRQRALTDRSAGDFFLADGSAQQGEDTVIFYDSLNKGLNVMRVDPIEFTRQFCDLALSLEPALSSSVVPTSGARIPLMDPEMADQSVFVSYARRDHEAAFRVVAKLRERGCKVWLDTERLMCGDDFENELQQAVMKRCGFFVSLISNTTESRSESYFLKERNWAAQRFASMAQHARPFYFPVVIDDSPIPPRHEPPAFAKIDCERAVNGEISDALVERLAHYQHRLLAPA
jgi:hypothetical protein